MKEERQIKRWIKNKFSYTTALLITILITGVVGFSATTTEDEIKELKKEIEKLKTDITNARSSIIQLRLNTGMDTDGPNGYVGSVILGNSASVNKNYYAIAIGNEAKSINYATIAIGNKSESTNSYGISLGNTAISDGQAGISIGYKSYSTGTGSIALGAQTTTRGYGSIASGFNSKALGIYSIAQGFGATAGEIIKSEEYDKLSEEEKKNYVKITNTTYFNINDSDATAIGHSAEARNYGVSLGPGAKAIGESSISLGRVATSTGYNAISIGNASEAVNYRALSIGVGSKSGTNSVSLGSHTDTSNSEFSVAIGNKATVNESSGISIGNDAIVNAGSSIAIGAVSKADSISSVALGAYSETNRKSKEFGYVPILGRNIENAKEMFEFAKIDGDLIYNNENEIKKLENEAKLARVEYEKILADANPDNSATNKVKLKEIQDKIVELDDKRQEILNSMPIELGTWSNSFGEVSVGNGYKTRQITNVAAGSRDSDAVNVAQLKSAVELTKNLQKATGLTDEDIKNIMDGKEKTLIERIQGSLSSESKGALAGVASAMAMSSIPQVIDKENPIAVGGAVSLYKGEAAFALGVSGVNKKGNIIFKASSSINTKLDLGASFGLSYAIGNVYSNDGLKLETEDKSEIVNYVNKVENDLKEYKAQTDKNMQLANKKIEDLEKKLEAVLKNQSNNTPVIQQVVTTTTPVKEINEAIKDIVSEKVYVISGFVTNDYRVSETDRQQLRNLVDRLNENVESATIDVVGHTDVRGGFEYNLDLGLRRAKEIVDLLKSYGLKPEIRIRNITSGGVIAPVSDTYAGNRRVEIHFDNIETK